MRRQNISTYASIFARSLSLFLKIYFFQFFFFPEGGFVWKPCGSLQRTLLWGWEFLLLPPQPPQGFQSEALKLYFPCTGTLGCAVSLSLPSCFSQFISAQMWDCLVFQLPPCRESSLSLLPVSSPPSGLDECFFFNFSVVKLQYSSIFWQFWLFFVFKLFVVLLLVVWGGKVYLPMPPSWPKSCSIILK